jgi:hypothetical protein
MAKQTFSLAPCSLHLRGHANSPGFSPGFLAVLRLRERAGGEDVAAFNFLSPLCTEVRLYVAYFISHPSIFSAFFIFKNETKIL